MNGFLPNEIKKPKDGIPTNNIVNKIDEEKLNELTCSICKNLVWNPVDCSKCGKLFCKYCLNKSLKKVNNFCPMCRAKPFKSSNCKALKITFLDIKLKCPNDSCKENLKYNDYISHLEKCEFKKYHCVNKDCNYENTLNNKNDMESHFNTCKYRITNCKFCGKKMVGHRLENHHGNDCPKFIIKCNDCFESMTREDYNNAHTKNKCLKNQIKLLKDEIFILKNEIIEIKEVIKEKSKSNEKDCKKELNSNQQNPMTDQIKQNPMMDQFQQNLMMGQFQQIPMMGQYQQMNNSGNLCPQNPMMNDNQMDNSGNQFMMNNEKLKDFSFIQKKRKLNEKE